MPAVQIVGRDRSRTRVFCLGACAVMLVVLVWSRLANLGTSFWSDEAYSAYYYAGRGPRAIFFSTYVPNNHALFNLLSWATTGFVGRFEAAYRFWSVVPGIAAVVLAASWAWRRLGPITATALVVLATVSPVHLVLTPQARGYGLAMLAAVVMLIGAVRASDHERTRDIVVFAAGALVGTWTLPVFGVAAVFQAAVLVWNPRLRRRALIATGVVAAASLVFYAPMLTDIVRNADQEFGQRLAVVGMFTGAYHQLAAPTVGNTLPADPHGFLNQTATFLVIAALSIAAVVRLWRTAERALLAHLVVPVFGTYVVLVVGRFYVQPRFASFLLFHVLLLLAIGVQAAWDALGQLTPARAVAAALIVAVAVLGTSRVGNVVEAQAAVPWENNQFFANFAKSTGINYVYTDTAHPGALFYYMGPRRVRWLHERAVKQQAYCAVKNRFIFVDDTYHQTVKPNLRCLLNGRHAQRFDVPQQLDPPIRRPGRLTIYLVPAARKRA